MLMSHHGRPARVCDKCHRTVSNMDTCLISYTKEGEQLDYCNRDCLTQHGVLYPKIVEPAYTEYSDGPAWSYTRDLAEGFTSWGST